MKPIFLYIVLSITIVLSFSNLWAETPTEILRKEKQLLPEPVFSLFYAVKNSLYYGFIEGHSEKMSLEKELTNYIRVFQDLLCEVLKHMI
jgi:hypothetical protein